MKARTEAEIMKNWPKDYDAPLVTVLAISYCHEKYLRTALDSIIAQETSFPFEVVVHDDASPDGSPDIIKEYAERYPNIICPVLEEENQFSKGVQAIMRAVKPYIKGRYIAYLECDDYWTDAHKLQEQVDYLENHPAFLAVTHNCTVVDADGKPNGEQYPECRDEEYTAEHFFRDILAGQSGTLMVRDIFTQSPDDHPLIVNAPSGPFDRAFTLTLLQNGRIHCIQKCMSAYRHVTDSGTSFSATYHYDIRQEARFYLSFVNYCKKMGRIGDAIGALRLFINYTNFHVSNGHVSRQEADSLLLFCRKSIASLTDRLMQSSENLARLAVYVQQTESTGYTEEKSLYRSVAIDKRYSCAVPLTDFGEITNLRIDPMQKPCILRHISVHLFNANGEKVNAAILRTNAISFQDVLIFCTDDPQIELCIPKGSYKSVSFSSELVSCNSEEIKYLREVAEIEAELRHSESERNNLSSNYNLLKTELSDEKDKYRLLSEKTAGQIKSLSEELQETNDKYKIAARQIDNISHQYGILQSSYHEVLDSHCWKWTRPIRWFGDLIKGVLRRSGPPTLTRKDELILSNANTAVRGVQLAIDKIDELNNAENIKIAVHVHLFYEDLLEEICGYLDNIPFPFDVFVSVREGVNLKQIARRLEEIKKVQNVSVEQTVNRGRDIAPLYVQFGERIKKYDYFLHVHSKKSLFTGTEQKEWRHYSLDALLGSEEKVRKVFALLCDRERNVGLVYPETRNQHLIAHSWLSNRLAGKNLLKRMGMPFEDGFFNYPVGSFFWANTTAVHNLFDLGLKYEDFPVEAGQTDGTTAHTLERVIAFVNKNNAYHSAILDDEDGVVRFDVSLKIFSNYFALQYESAQYYLARFDLVSFDIFDTLISRSVCRPDDMFRLIGKRIGSELGIKCDFLSVRKAAEAKANSRKGKYTNIYDIYEALPAVCSELGKYADAIMQWELDMELDLCFPREDMLKVYNRVRANGGRILLVSDMYLPKAFLAKMLSKCGYEGYEDIWVSCDRGERKDDGSMWESFYESYGSLKTVHCGDNPQSDIQLPGDFRKGTFFILNPFDGAGLSGLNSLIKKWSERNPSVSSSVFMGLIINKRFFNSPFVLGENGILVINNPFEFGYASLGPLLVYFTEWIVDNCAAKKILFLSREGYIFKQFFDIYSKIFKNADIADAKDVYFLASRRAASFGAIRTAEDVREILMTYYEGPLSNLLRERLGIDVTDEAREKDKNIALPRDIDALMDLLSSYMPEILERASAERAAYKKYISEAVDDISDAAIVDVGYSGTIQYFLSKMLDLKIAGFYLSTWVDKKPEDLGCNCMSAFPVTDPSEEHTNLIFKNQLFLEAFLKAPFGQLIKFVDSEGDVQPVYNRDDEIPMDLKLMQEGALSFAEEYWGIIKKYAPGERLDGDFASELFDYMLNSEIMGQRVADCLSVSDDYCSNGNWCYSIEEKKFIIK